MDFPKLNLPKVEFKTKLVNGTTQVFDVVRKKYFKLTSEEWVRQHFIHYLNTDKNYPISLMGVEKMLKYNNLKKRADIVIYNKLGDATMIVECKASSVNLNQEVFYQIARYNFVLKVKYLVVTNGRMHYCCSIDYRTKKVDFLKDIPVF
tara:strand:- start:64 stop:510 length:447 start_codon:yes stop_codon:yes gene_type:complete